MRPFAGIGDISLLLINLGAGIVERGGTASLAFPHEHGRQIWSNNRLERLNKEVKRRTNVVGVFPNAPAVIRLV